MGVLGDEPAADVPLDPLAMAIAKQEEVLRSMQHAHGEFHPSVSDDLAQLAMLHNMRGDHERALTLLHRRLVIHEKHGPPERIGETLHELGTTYRLQGVPDIARQHLERALATRVECHGDASFSVGETLNSLALMYQDLDDHAQSDDYQHQSLRVLLASSEPEDIESEDIPWEVYKRLKQQRGPSTAANSVTLFKGTMRQCVNDALSQAGDGLAAAGTSPRVNLTDGNTTGAGKSVEFFGATNSSPRAVTTPSPTFAGRATRSKSDSAMLKLLVERDALEDFEGRLSAAQAADEMEIADDQDEILTEAMERAASLQMPAPPQPSPPLRRHTTPILSPTSATSALALSELSYEEIGDASTLQARVESVKRRLVSGAVDMEMEMARLASDVELISATELRQLGETMVDLVREMHHMRLRADREANTTQMPVLEGHLEKKSASIFRGWEKRFFKVDPKTFILSYHFSRDDHARGFAPRGGFPVARIANISMHRQQTSSRHGGGAGSSSSSGWFHFDVVVDLSTRLNPHAARTYELRADSADARRYWVETLHYYKAKAQSTNAGAMSPSSRRPGTS